VIWNTREVRRAEETDHPEIDQKITVTCNFEGVYEGDIVKSTDVAWESDGDAEWNYRMVFPLQVPCRVPRLKFAMWDEHVVADDEIIGEVVYNLQPFFDRCLRDKKPLSHQGQKWLTFTHPNYPDATMGEVCIELWLLSQAEADLEPVGEAQSEPNRKPPLRKPDRNLPPWMVGSRTLNWLQRRRNVTLMICLAVCLLPLLIPIMLQILKSTIFKGL